MKFKVIGKLKNHKNGLKGYLDFGVLGNINIKIYPNKEHDKDEWHMVVFAAVVDTPFGMIRAIRERIEEALWEESNES